MTRPGTWYRRREHQQKMERGRRRVKGKGARSVGTWLVVVPGGDRMLMQEGEMDRSPRKGRHTQPARLARRWDHQVSEDY